MSGYTLYENASKLNEFENLDGFLDRVLTLDEVVERPVYVDAAMRYRRADGYKALVYAKTGDPASIVSRRYRVIQHKDALLEIGDAFRRYDVEPQGYVCETETGMLNAKVLFKNPEYQLAPDTEARDDDLIALGFSITNSYGNPAVAFSLEGMGIRYVCWNLNLWGENLGRHSIRHVGDVETRIGDALRRLTNGIPWLQESIHEAGRVRLKSREEAVAALVGAGFGPRIAQNIALRGEELERSWDDKPSLWAVYNAATAFVTRRDIQEATKDDQLRRAAMLLPFGNMRTGIDALIGRGSAILHEAQGRGFAGEEIPAES